MQNTLMKIGSFCSDACYAVLVLRYVFGFKVQLCVVPHTGSGKLGGIGCGKRQAVNENVNRNHG
jgi:hypothetical protein